MALLLSLVGCGWWDDRIRADAETYLRKAVDYEQAGHLDAAIAEYRKALERLGTRDRWKTQAVEIRGLIKELEARKHEVAAATAEFERLKARAAQGTGGGLLKEARELHRRVRDSGLPWLPELAALLQRLEAGGEGK